MKAVGCERAPHPTLAAPRVVWGAGAWGAACGAGEVHREGAGGAGEWGEGGTAAEGRLQIVIFWLI